jgi:hypothetical protein
MAVAVPDFGALAGQQKTANDQAANQTNMANRPNQYNPMGSITWGQNPDGSWGQSTSLSGGAQGLFDSSISGQQNLGNQIGAGVDYGNLPAMPDSGFGASQQVINAWNALQQPGLDKSAAAARNRAAAMGITIGSNAQNDIERTIGTNEATSRNQGILAGTQEFNNVFNRGMQARQQGQKEALDKYNAAISGSSALGSARDSLNPNKWAADVPTSAAFQPQTIYGAAMDTFSANRQNENAEIAAKQAQTQSYVDALRAAGGGGGLAGIAQGIGSLWNTGSSIYNAVSGWF